MIESGLVIKNVHFRGVSSSDYIQKNEGYVMMSKGRGKGLPFDQSPHKELLYSKAKWKSVTTLLNIELWLGKRPRQWHCSSNSSTREKMPLLSLSNSLLVGSSTIREKSDLQRGHRWPRFFTSTSQASVWTQVSYSVIIPRPHASQVTT